jgi:hypothetical protein
MHHVAGHTSPFSFPYRYIPSLYIGGTLFLAFWNAVTSIRFFFSPFPLSRTPITHNDYSVLGGFFWISCHELTPGFPSPFSSFLAAYKRIRLYPFLIVSFRSLYPEHQILINVHIFPVHEPFRQNLSRNVHGIPG